MLSSREWPLTMTAMVTAASHNTGVRESGFKFLVLLFEKHKLQLAFFRGKCEAISSDRYITHKQQRSQNNFHNSSRAISTVGYVFSRPKKMAHRSVCVAFRS